MENYDYETIYECSPHTQSRHFTKLMYAIMKKGEIKKEYMSESEINRKNEEGWTALMLAARNSSTYSSNETVKLLLDNGADVNLKNNRGLSALMLAVENSKKNSSSEIVKLLLDNGADVNLKKERGTTALMLAVRNSRTGSSN